MLRYQEVRREYDSKLSLKQSLVQRNSELAASKSQMEAALVSLQDEIDVLAQKLQISEFEFRRVERRLKLGQEFAADQQLRNLNGDLHLRKVPITASNL